MIDKYLRVTREINGAGNLITGAFTMASIHKFLLVLSGNREAVWMVADSDDVFPD